MPRLGRPKSCLLLCSVLVFVSMLSARGGLLRGSAQSAETAHAVTPAPPALGRVCARCHELDVVLQGRRSRLEWDEVLNKMVIEGAKASDDEFVSITDYLVAEYGRVNINVEVAAEVAQVLHLDLKAASAIVEHRTRNGKFADFDALIAVPGAPVEALKARRDAILF